MPLLLCCFCLVCSSPYQLKLGVSSVRLDNHSAFLCLFSFIAFFPGKTRCLLFFPGCGQPLGVARGGNSELPDSMIKASSEDYRYPASSGRLKDSGWAPVSSDEDPYPYLQIDLDNLYLVCGVKVQGCEDFDRKQAWVTRYRVQVSPEKDFWESWNYIKVWFYYEPRYS